MRRFFVVPTILALMAASAGAEPLANRLSEGWNSWIVPAVEDGGERCCYSWHGGTVREKGCALDGGRGGFSAAQDGLDMGNEVQLFARLERGKVTKVRALSLSCPVSSDSGITDLGRVDAGTSVAWLRQFLEQRSGLSSEAISAVAAHDGDEAAGLLMDTAESGRVFDHRKEAIFWIAQSRPVIASETVRQLMFHDPSEDIREHAAFSLSQSKVADRHQALIRLGRTDASEQVRSQSWFWLAQTGAPEAESEIRRAIREDRSAKVRREAVFALSQLPDDAGVDVLIDLLRDRRQDIKVREQALFWLAQSDSDEAIDAIDQLLGGG